MGAARLAAGTGALVAVGSSFLASRLGDLLLLSRE